MFISNLGSQGMNTLLLFVLREEYRLEKRCLAKGGDVVWGHHTVSLVRDGFTRPKFAIAMLEDITT